MKNLNIKDAIISACVIWTLAVLAFITSYFVPILPDPDLQANWVLSIALIPSAFIGTHLYYRRGHSTNGLVLGISMFLVAMILDATITVPFLVMPLGGDHISFFTDVGFWLIAMEYISAVVAYRPLMRFLQKVDNFRVTPQK